MFTLTRFLRLLVFTILLVTGANFAHAQTSTFTYQGRLTDGGTPANGTYDLQFKLYDALTGGNLQGSPNTVTRTGVNVTNGIFTVQLDFGTTGFPGADRFLDIGVKHPADSSYTSLVPRQQLTTTPYAIQASNAFNATQLGGVAANQYVLTTDARMTDARDPLSGSSNYIQNGTVAQASTNFNILGNGTAGGTLSGNAVNANSQYNIGGNRVLSNAGSLNLFAGSGAGANNLGNGNAFFGASAGSANTTGERNAIFGADAGLSNTTGADNSFFGASAGLSNTTGGTNSFFGSNTGQQNTTGFDNSFFGELAGASNQTGQDNSFFGTAAGQRNTASRNSFFGSFAGFNNTTGSVNSFFGNTAGYNNTTGVANSFFGDSAGYLNTTGQSDSFFGRAAGNVNTTGFDNSFFGAAAGDRNSTGNENSFFGTAAGFNNTNGSANSFFGRGAGAGNTTASGNSFFGAFAGNFNSTGTNNSFFGESAGGANTTANNNSFFGYFAGNNTTADANSFFGSQAGLNNSTGTDNTFIGQNAGSLNNTENRNTFLGSNTNAIPGVVNATAIGAYAFVTQSNSLVLGSINGAGGGADTNVGIGTTAPNARFHIAVNGGNILLGDAGCPSGSTAIGFGSSLSGCTNYSLRGDGTDTNINRPTGGAIFFRENNTAQVVIESGGVIAINALGGGPGTALCRNSLHEISNCSSSLRYKDHLASFTSGLNLINRLRPITFNWKQSGERDLGFAAEDVAAIEPLLVTHNDKGQIEGVKYDRLSVAFVNAFKEQQAQIQRQQQQLKNQQNQINALRKLICLDRPNADVCK